MAAVKCKGCGAQVWTKAGACPVCGAKPSRKAKVLAWVALALIVFVVLKGVFSGEPAHTTAQKSTPMDVAEGVTASQSMPELSSGPAPIRSGALDSYTKATHPKVFAKWGSDGAARIEAHQKLAADKIANSGQCDAISIVGLSEQRSSPPANISVFVDCENGKRFYVGSKDAAGAAPRSEFSQAMSERAAVSACEAMVKAGSKFPSSVDISSSGIASDIHKTTGLTTVYMSYEAKNGIGVNVPQEAFCSFPVGDKPKIEVRNR